MKTHEIEIMSKKEEKLVDILQLLGFKRGTAKTLVYMLIKKTSQTKDIERAMNLRQPEVSIGTTELQKLGILSKRYAHHKRGKGRPTHLYTLNKSVSDVKDFLIKKMQEKIEKTERDLESLKTLMKGGE